jgi:hypothetical protein
VGLLGLLRVVGPLPVVRLGLLLFDLVAFLFFPFDLFPPGLLPPERIIEPSVMADQGDLYGTNVRIKLGADDGFDHPHAVRGDLPGFDALLLKLDIFLGDLAEGVIEDRYVVLDAEANIGVLVEGPLPRRVDVGRLQGNRLVAVLVGEPDPAVPIASFERLSPPAACPDRTTIPRLPPPANYGGNALRLKHRRHSASERWRKQRQPVSAASSSVGPSDNDPLDDAPPEKSLAHLSHSNFDVRREYSSL